MTKILKRITISGRVQGVGFRQASLREARYLGITGYVKNCSDGSVFIEAEGTPDKMEQFLQWCRRGPGFGWVEDVSIESGMPLNHSSFIIKH